ncbi:putative pentatricopeptide repeat-containing protein-like, chloroplastic [Iris pallida]|uniref:Pentatricopeptide repeat-containing protein-like, chloroplastic n=1 Tax=Iris pallida TaxID=29817 RepID=A0AAX6E9Q5_IRIPA|nr:putative pentatricopeptide repeat-containing protein-like, chloroplastic [Iris pallida]
MDSLSLLTTTATATATTTTTTTTLPSPFPSKPPSSLPNPKSKPNNLKLSPQKTSFPESLPLHSKNPHIISRDIRRLARLGRISDALTVLDYLERRGIPVSATTFSSLLTAALRSPSHPLPVALHLHSHLRLHSLHRDPFLLSKLVSLYHLSGSPLRAHLLLADLRPDSAYPYNALLNLPADAGVDAVGLYHSMREAGVPANEYTFSRLLKTFAGSPAFGCGAKTHATLVKNGLYDSSVMLRTGLVDMYFKCKKIRWAVKVFDEIPEWEKYDVVLWGAVVAGFAHNRLGVEALEYFRRMGEYGIEANSVVITSVLPAIGELSEWNLGREVHGFVLKKFRYYEKLVSVQSGLISMYCKCGDLVSGRRVFYWSSQRNAVSWTALMSGYASNRRYEQALRSVVWMQKEGVKPDVVTIATALPVCTQLKALRQGKEIHAYALKHRFLPNVSIATSLMTMYSECGELDSSCRVFAGMNRKNVVSWTALIDSYIRDGRFVDALQVFRSMRLVHHRPDAVSIRRVLSVSGNLGALKMGREIHGQVYKMKMEAIPFVTAETVRMYGKCGDMGNARKVFDEVLSKGSLTCTAIIEAYGFNRRHREAINLFKWMRSNGFLPNHFTFDAILAICERAGWVEDALDAFDSMVQEYKLKATREHCDCIISLLDRAGRMNEAQKFLYLRSTLE